MARRTERRGAWRSTTLGLALACALPCAVSLAEPAVPGRLTTLRADPASPAAMDLGGARRDGVLPRTFAGARHAVVGRVRLAQRGGTPTEWRPGWIAVGTVEGLTVVSPDGASHTIPLGPIDARPVVLPSGELLAVGRDGHLAVIGRDLEVRCEARASSGLRGSPLVLPDGSTILATQDRIVARYDADLERVFATTLSVGLVHPPALLSPSRLTVAAGERLFVLDLAGNVLSQVDLGARTITPPVVDTQGDVHVLVATSEIVVVAGAHHVSRRVAVGGRVLDQSAVLAHDTDGSYRVAVPTLGVVALAADGTQRWIASTDAPFHGPLAIDAEHTTLAFDRRGRLAVISPAGEILERVELGGNAVGFPTLARDGTLWVSTQQELVQVGPEPHPLPPLDVGLLAPREEVAPPAAGP